MACRSTGRKPAEDTLKLYLPGTRNCTSQLPWSLVLVICLTSVLSEVTVTVALGMTAPWASVTRPPRVARAPCPHADVHRRAHAVASTAKFFIMSPTEAALPRLRTSIEADNNTRTTSGANRMSNVGVNCGYSGWVGEGVQRMGQRDPSGALLGTALRRCGEGGWKRLSCYRRL